MEIPARRNELMTNLILVLGGTVAQELPGQVLTKHVHGIIDLDHEMIADILQILLLRAHEFAFGGFDFVSRPAVEVNPTFNDDRIAVDIALEGFGSTVLELDLHFGGVRSGTDERFERGTSVLSGPCSVRLSKLEGAEVVRTVVLAFPPRATVIAVRTALFPPTRRFDCQRRRAQHGRLPALELTSIVT